MAGIIKSYVLGLIINIQFFSSIPIKKEIPMTPKNLEKAIQTFPVLGCLQGFIYAGLLYGLLHWTVFSHLAIAFVIWLSIIILTGGIHLDGWIDCSDAFFSYRDREKRLEIMKDPRTGAFGVISVIVLLSVRFLFIYEIILKAGELSYLLIVFIPFLSKMLMGMALAMIPLAKKEGLGYLFQQACQQKTLWVYPFYLAVVFIFQWLWQKEGIVIFSCMLLSVFVIFLFLRRKVVDWFGGISGDVIGAATEGAECGLWMIVWLFHYYGMG
jgi:adenosylcobinamide-GDP ribazoletransferase